MANIWDTKVNTIPSYSDFGSGTTNPIGSGIGSLGSYDWGRTDTGIDWNQTPEVAKEKTQPDWLGAGMKALEAATKFQQRGSVAQRAGGTEIAGSPRVVYQNRDVTIIQPGRTQTTETKTGGGGIVSGILGVAAPIASIIPGGQAIGAGLAAAGRGASMFGI